MKILCIAVPDDAEVVVVPKVVTTKMLIAWHKAYEHGKWNAGTWDSAFQQAHNAMLDAAPSVKMCELPEYDNRARDWNDCLDEIERRLA